MTKQPAAKQAPPIKPLPDDVLQLLHAQAKTATQVVLADQLGVSTSAVNQAIHDKYRGNVERLCARVRGLWAGDTVSCPVLGSISTKVCIDQQAKGVVYSNPMRVALAKACKTCQHAQKHNGGSHDQAS